MSGHHPPAGVVVVDKPAGCTSHDVVGRIRRLAGTRRVGHAGTLDPAATGVLVVGYGRATRLLGYLAAGEKTYAATIRLGQATATDDAQSPVLRTVPVHRDDRRLAAAVATLVGPQLQRPPQFSAVKVAGRPAYARARVGERVELPARPVTVHEFDVRSVHPGPDGTLDVHARIHCTAGTYVRALARDLGAALGVGGHLTQLRRLAAGRFTLREARTLAELTARFEATTLDRVVAEHFPRREVDEEAARVVGNGGWLAGVGLTGPVGLFDPHGQVVALVRETAGLARPLCVFR